MKTFISALVSSVILVALFVASCAVVFYSFYVPYNYFANQAWLIENMEIIAFLPISWYALWASEKYGMKLIVKLIVNSLFGFVSLKYKLTEEHRQEVYTKVYEAMIKHA